MTHAIFEERVSQFRAMVFEGTEQLAEAKVSVTAAMDRLFGVHPYTTTEGWLVGGIEGNGEVNKSGPDKSPAWWQRIEKARREIQEHKTECRIRVAAAAIQLQQIENDIKEIRRWQNSLLPQLVAG